MGSHSATATVAIPGAEAQDSLRPAGQPARKSGDKRRMFGVDDRVPCSTCGQDTYLRRRSPHAGDGQAYELQTFACRGCKSLTTRIVDQDGRPAFGFP
jgi:hypothetical protein